MALDSYLHGGNVESPCVGRYLRGERGLFPSNLIIVHRTLNNVVVIVSDVRKRHLFSVYDSKTVMFVFFLNENASKCEGEDRITDVSELIVD